MIKNYFEKELNFANFEISSKITYEFDEEYTLINHYDDIVAVGLACSYFEDLHFCVARCIGGLGFSKDSFYLFVLSSEYGLELKNRIMYLIDSVHRNLLKQQSE